MSRMLQAPLQPPRPSEHSISLADEYAETCSQRRDDYFDEAMDGHGQLWPRGHDFAKPESYPEWDGVQAWVILAAVRDAMHLPADAFKTYVMRIVEREAKEYAGLRVEMER